MAKVRKITRKPAAGKNYYLVDSNFLANKHIPPEHAPVGHERDRVLACRAWWNEIDKQLEDKRARVYVPDICIAEAFKVLAKKYYTQRWFPNAVSFARAKSLLSKDIHVEPRKLKLLRRNIGFHDVSTNRDIIISVDRFFEIFHNHKKNVQIADLILISTAKYLIDFFDIPKDRLHIVTLDVPLREGVAKVVELPRAYDPTLRSHRVERVFV